jgi:mycothiol system anti-sigma-R factor
MTDCPRDSIDCRSAVQKLWDYLDEELTPERMDAVREHLERCGSCLPHHDYARTFLDALATARSPDTCAPEALRRRVIERLQAAGFRAGE